jgi:hypothetical protein
VSFEDDELSGWPSTSKVEEIRELIHEDCRRTTCEPTDTTGFSYGVATRA